MKTSRTRTSHTVVLFLALFVLGTSSQLFAQTPLMFEDGVWKKSKAVALIQGEKRQLSDDFVAQLEGDSLIVSLEDRGFLNVNSGDELLVTLVQSSGERIDASPDMRGSLVFQGVQQGLAALVVTADSFANTSVSSLYAAIPFFVTEKPDPDVPADAYELPLALVSPGALTERIENEVDDFRDETEVMNDGEFDVVPQAGRFRVQRLADGSVQGKVVVPQRSYLSVPGVTRISFQKDGITVANAVSDEEGDFVADDVPVGVNSIVATSRVGHAAYSIEVVEFQGAEELEPPVVRSGEGRIRFVSFPQPAADSMIICLIPPALMDDVRQVLDERMSPPVVDGAPVVDAFAPMAPPAAGGFGTPAGGGFAGGGGFGGGGGGFGGGGLGGAAGLAGLAGLAIGVTALADDDDGFNANPASPIVP
jgi:uncharacterized membrane protein YgcG